tara:strand:- start:280 stop:600 length:321 start_codon:yes stop_codon:yes gene_type:complete
MAMPYADPETKRKYMEKYNKEYYSNNKKPRDLVQKSVKSKSTLRMKKRIWLLEALGLQNDPAAPKFEFSHADNEGSVLDYSWADLQTHLSVIQVGTRSQLRTPKKE